ncbi:long-chain-fatty-acid--CoA ligase [Alteribacillus bidgolensis]|uniref:Long-chain acyl-CoA synthetase n=1 Tax=Alteribacillus bidgolensis TaxID=930129 RepID=A0A1G8F0U2_9BACI|nr:long-chain-fatty-acid--CoA ligase [Alteribacillus bidgolensis]SDH75694.1 long-chain acyl-CoA synthetase [Alteribacillus bidgolensis]
MRTDKESIWYEQYPKEIPLEISYEKKPLPAFLKESAAHYADHHAMSFFGKQWSYQQLLTDASSFANQLIKLGIEKGDRVAIMLPNTPQSVISYYGVLMAGAIVVQTNPLYVERELNHQLIDSGAKAIVCLDMFYPRVMKAMENTSLEHVIVTGIKDALAFPKNILYPLTQRKNNEMKVQVDYNETTHHFHKLIEDGESVIPEVDIAPESDLALLQYTGGTTGPAKGVMLTHYNLVANTTQCLRWMYKMRQGKEKTLAVLPFFHVYGMTVSMNLSIMHAAELVILPKFDPEEVLKTIEKQKITLFPGAPTMYIGLLNNEKIHDFDLSSIEACISGSAPLPLEIQQQFEEVTGGKLVEGYGLTEASPVTHCNLIWEQRKEGSIGLPWPDTEAAILTQHGQFAPKKEIGEIAVRGPQVMKGYWNRPEETSAAFKDGWLLTGDMGYMDQEGYFYIADRKKDMIIAGGFNIYPREIEEVLYEHDNIQEAVVIGVPDPYRGETIKAFIVKKEGAEVNEKQLDDYCRSQLASFKVPRLYEFRNQLPKTSVGKILKRVLIEEEKEHRTSGHPS